MLKRYEQVLVPEMNMGQLVMVLRAKYLVDAQGYNKIQGKPFKQSEIEAEDRRNSGLKPDRSDLEESGEKNDHGHDCQFTRRRIFRPTRKSAGARAAAITPFSPPCRPCSPSWAFRAKSSW